MSSSSSPLLVNPLMERLRAGGLGLAIQIRHAFTVDIAIGARTCGFDALYFDFQHTPVREETAAQIAAAGVQIGMTSIVRVPEGDYGMALRMLDAGALGIVVPDLTTAEDARRAVAHCKFAPLGQRSAAGSYPHFGYRGVPVPQAREALNNNTTVIAMVESKAALENVEAIAAVPGVDIVHLGSNDFASDLGIPGQLDHPQVLSAIERIVAACHKHGKFPGVGGLAGADPRRFEQVVKLGGRFLSAANEWSLMMSAGTQRVQALRALLR